MRSMTNDEAKRFCLQLPGSLQLAEDDSLCFDDEEEEAFFINSPQEFRQIGFLANAITHCAPHGGLLWLNLMFGAEGLVEASIRIIEDMRLSIGDRRSLQVAPAQQFQGDEGLQLQITLMQVIGNGWNAYFVPSDANFVLGFRSTHRIFCYYENEVAIETLRAALQPWIPQEVNN